VALATFLVDMSWPARLGLIALLVVVLAGYLLVRARRTGGAVLEPADAALEVDPGPKA
jgi:hypothetical protein